MEGLFYVKLEQLRVKDQKDPRKLVNQVYNVQITILAANVSEPWPLFKLGLTPPPKARLWKVGK